MNRFYVYFYIAAFVLTGTTSLSAQSTDRNFSSMSMPLVPVSADSAHTLPDSLKRTRIRYYDGLGRFLQSVGKQASPGGNDVVLPAEYDAFGRRPKQYLPYAVEAGQGLFRNEALAEQNLFYQQAPDVAHDPLPYAASEYEASPLNRVLRRSGIGQYRSLATPHTVKSKIRTNTADEVPMLRFDAVSETYVFEGFYAAGTVTVSEVRDAYDRLSLAYTDADGRLLLKKSEADVDLFASVLYVYDEFGFLRCTVQPEGVRQLQDNGWQLTPTILEEQCFVYEYDELGRPVVDKRPSSEPLWTVYDRDDRAVLVQDGNLRQKNQWQYVKYDGLGRPVLTGLYTDAMHPTRESVQALLDAETVLAEKRSGENFAQQYGYTNDVFPRENTETLTVSYYDDYDYNRDGKDEVDYANDADFPEPPTSRLQGMATGSLTKLLGTEKMLLSSVFYDERGRPVQAQAEHHKDGRDVVWQAYAFTGEPTKTRYRHCRKNGQNENELFKNTDASEQLTSKVRRQTRRIKKKRGEQTKKYKILPIIETCRAFTERYEYDKEGRLLGTFLQTDDGLSEVQTAAYAYNEVGQPIRKDVHRSDTSVLQRADYAYDISGALARINDPYLNDPQDLFGMELRYDQGILALQSGGYRDGNISALLWRSQRDTLTRGYGFRYDALNRLQRAYYAADDGSQTWAEQKDYYDMEVARYDLNGNLTELRNFGKVAPDTYADYVDLLKYQYQGNRLMAVNDGVDVPYSPNDFKDNGFFGSVDNPEYFYDANGNRTSDKNKQQQTVYNFLNLPETVMQGPYTIRYLRDASGTKRAAQVWKDNQLVRSRDYLGPFEYENDTLRALEHSEGFVRYAHEQGKETPHWLYRYTDHLGSVRMVYEAAYVQDTAYLCTMEEGKDEEGEYPKFKNVSATRDKQQAQEGECSAMLLHEQGPLIGIPVRHGQKLETSVWYMYEPWDIIVLPIKEQEPAPRPRKKKRFPFTIGIANQARMPKVTGDRSDKTPLPALQLTGTLGLGPKQQQQQQQDLPNLPSPNAGLRFVLTDTSDNTLHTEVKSVGPFGGSWQKIAHAYVTDLKKYGLEEGILKIYVENEEEKTAVWFDSLYIESQTVAPKIVQENTPNPFGNDIPDLAYYATSDTLNHLYNGQELDRITGALDYGWRQYDPQIGRWGSQDPLAEYFYAYSPYNYVLNNPVNYFDVAGMYPDVNGDEQEGGGRPRYDLLGNLIEDDDYIAFYAMGEEVEITAKWVGHGGEEIDFMDPLGFLADFGDYGDREQMLFSRWNNNNVRESNVIAPPAPILPLALSSSAAALAATSVLVTGDVSVNQKRQPKKTYVTYVKYGPGGKVYVGRSSGVDNPAKIVATRDSRHHIKGFGPAVLDKFSTSYHAIRGREQQLIDYFGGVGSKNVANSIRAVSPYNPRGLVYHGQSDINFGNIAPYTGYYKLNWW